MSRVLGSSFRCRSIVPAIVRTAAGPTPPGAIPAEYIYLLPWAAWHYVIQPTLGQFNLQIMAFAAALVGMVAVINRGGATADELVAFVDEFAGLGDHLRAPFRTYSAGMRARLAFAVSMGVPFDVYLIDEITSVGDAAFRARSEAALVERLRSAGAIVVSHSLQLLARMCDAGMVLEDGRLTWHDDVMAAIAHHRAAMGVAE